LADQAAVHQSLVFDNVLVHSDESQAYAELSGNYDFLKTAELDERRQSSVISRQ